MNFNKPKAVILDGYAANPGDLSWDGLRELADLEVYDRTPVPLIRERIEGAEIVFTNKTPLSASDMDSCPTLRYIGVLATGYNIVDISAAASRGITVANIPGYSTKSVAQLAAALLLEVCHHTGEHSRAVLNGEWCNAPDYSFWNYPLLELDGLCCGIFGMGAIGSAFADIASSFGMKVIYTNSRGLPVENSAYEFVTREELFSRSDVISFHCPQTEATKNIINRENIEKMKQGVIIINTSRGGLADEKALAEALNSGRVAYYACDVLSSEPPSPDNPLLSSKNTIITPHIAWAPPASRKRLISVCAGNLRAYLNGNAENRVN